MIVCRVLRRTMAATGTAPATALRTLILPPRLTEKESHLFAVLKDVVHKRAPQTTLRVAGGWVRDKLLGLESHDIDVAIDNMTGAQFAELVNAHLSEQGEKTKNVGVIKRNPEQSKHLETATAQVLDMWVDFVNLRAETYEADSRIPDVVFGTPAEDAFRRDITINALFYNVNEDKIEDFTEKGLGDLQQGIIRTPLPPKTTFTDDPLRVLRVIRFATRFGYTIAPVVREALCDLSVHTALRTKVSRERVGIEVDKMLRGPSPAASLLEIVNLGLYDVVFTPPDLDAVSSAEAAPQHASEVVSRVNRLIETCLPKLTEEERRLAFLTATLIKFRKVPSPNGTMTAVETIIRDHLKLPNTDMRNVSLALDAALEWPAHLRENVSRSGLGLLLRKAGTTWRASLLVSVAETTNDGAVIERAIALVNEWLLDGVWDTRPLMNGKEVASTLGIQQGKLIGKIIEELMAWQLDHASATAADAEKWLLTDVQPRLDALSAAMAVDMPQSRSGGTSSKRKPGMK